VRELETGRLRLRRFTPADLDELAALHGDRAVMRYIDDGKPVPREVVARQGLPAFLREYDELPDGLGHYAIVERADGRFAGWVSLLPPSSVGLEPQDGVELGYRLRGDRWGRGIAAEAARAVVELAFVRLGIERIVATTMAVNTGSRRVLEKTGLRHLSTFFAEWPEYIEGAEHGDVVYELTREQWRAARADAGPLNAGGRATPG
jgi:RimJ/RimL family protein N-acetyltransferase